MQLNIKALTHNGLNAEFAYWYIGAKKRAYEGLLVTLLQLIHFDFNKPSFGKLKQTKVFWLLNLKI